MGPPIRRTTVDVRRIGLAASYPGIDPRTWVSAGRLDDDPDALRWDAGAGWIVDVGFYGTELDGETETPCRVMTTGPAGAGFGEYLPPVPGCELLVAISGGDPELNPAVVGYLRNSETCPPPSSINGLPINGEAPVSTPLFVSPYDTEIKRSPYHRREQYALDRHVQARNHILEAGEQVKLALRDADQSYVRGERFVAVLTAWIDAVSSYVAANGKADALVYGAVNTLAPGSIPLPDIEDVATAVVEVPAQQAAFKAAAVPGDALSERIKGD